MNDEAAFPSADRRLADLARALSHPARVAILRVLAARQTCVCGEIVDVMPLAQSTVSQHLKVLREVGLVSGTVDGPRSCYCLDAAGLAEAGALLSSLFATLSGGACTCTADVCGGDGCTCGTRAGASPGQPERAAAPHSSSSPDLSAGTSLHLA